MEQNSKQSEQQLSLRIKMNDFELEISGDVETVQTSIDQLIGNELIKNFALSQVRATSKTSSDKHVKVGKVIAMPDIHQILSEKLMISKDIAKLLVVKLDDSIAPFYVNELPPMAATDSKERRKKMINIYGYVKELCFKDASFTAQEIKPTLEYSHISAGANLSSFLSGIETVQDTEISSRPRFFKINVLGREDAKASLEFIVKEIEAKAKGAKND